MLISVYLNNFINLYVKKSSDCRSDLFKEHSLRPYDSARCARICEFANSTLITIVCDIYEKIVERRCNRFRTCGDRRVNFAMLMRRLL